VCPAGSGVTVPEEGQSSDVGLLRHRRPVEAYPHGIELERSPVGSARAPQVLSTPPVAELFARLSGRLARNSCHSTNRNTVQAAPECMALCLERQGVGFVSKVPVRSTFAPLAPSVELAPGIAILQLRTRSSANILTDGSRVRPIAPGAILLRTKTHDFQFRTGTRRNIPLGISHPAYGLTNAELPRTESAAAHRSGRAGIAAGFIVRPVWPLFAGKSLE
jgi:hypothetical protein